MKEHQTSPPTESEVVVVGLRDERLRFESSELRGSIVFLQGCRELRQYLSDHVEAKVVLTAVSLQDGNWCDVLNCLLTAENAPALILCSSGADERLWSEAIWRGVHDVIGTPVEGPELKRSVASAKRSSGAEPLNAKAGGRRARAAGRN